MKGNTMQLMPAAQQQSADADQTQDQSQAQDGQQDQDSIEIALRIKSDGSMAVVLEVNEDEGGEQETPVSSVDEACSTIKKIAGQVMSKMPNPDADQEQKAYENEMASQSA